MKSACNERKGAVCYSECGVKGLNTPLLCLIHYKGFCLMAVNKLPIGADTLKYGSGDGGKTVHASIPKLNNLMKEAGTRLNLAPHRVLDKYIYGPGDIEAHLGTDNKFYVLDFGRVMPPEFPQKPSEIWYNLLRPEFVMNYKNSLCSDAFSQWLSGDKNEMIFNEEVTKATVHLQSFVIPDFAKYLDANPQIKTLSMLICEVHQKGINIRHMGRLRQQLTDHKVKQLVLTECVARTLKNLIRGILREKMKQLQISIEEPYKTEVFNFLKPIFGCYQDHPTSLLDGSNVAFSHSFVTVNSTVDEDIEEEVLSKSSLTFWRKTIKIEIEERYPSCLLADERNENFDLRCNVDMSLVIQRFQILSGIKLSPFVEESWREKKFFYMTSSDVQELNSRVSYLSIVDYSEALSIYSEIESSTKMDKKKQIDLLSK
eukprot:TRINITY_DN5198_c0_g1_i5.p1 TRINITY_DN5198_c0_g1~~TRINITY_DN5198_c0_g1_i5.p1  ORF type:complete len:429 (+),score=94.60 TRINITY_DN5198_c0_g1_i5:1108-2394(+)